MSRGFDAFRPLVAGTPAEDVIEKRSFVSGYKDPTVFESSSWSYALRKRRGVAFEVIDAARMATLDPIFAGRFSMGVIFPNAFWTRDPRAFTQTLLDDFVKRGGAERRAEVKEIVRQNGVFCRIRTNDSDGSAGGFVNHHGPLSCVQLSKLCND